MKDQDMNDYSDALAKLNAAERAYDLLVDRYMAAVRELDRVYLEDGMHRVEYTEARLLEVAAKGALDEAYRECVRLRREAAAHRNRK